MALAPGAHERTPLASVRKIDPTKRTGIDQSAEFGRSIAGRALSPEKAAGAKIWQELSAMIRARVGAVEPAELTRTAQARVDALCAETKCWQQGVRLRGQAARLVEVLAATTHAGSSW